MTIAEDWECSSALTTNVSQMLVDTAIATIIGHLMELLATIMPVRLAGINSHETAALSALYTHTSKPHQLQCTIIELGYYWVLATLYR